MISRWGKRANRFAVFALLLGAAGSHARARAEAKDQTAVMEAPVVAVRIVTEDGRVLAESPTGIAVEIGKPLDRDQVAKTIRALYRTGDYADLRAVATPVGSGVRLDFVVRENLFFNRVIIEGLTPPPTDASAGGGYAAFAGASIPARRSGRRTQPSARHVERRGTL